METQSKYRIKNELVNGKSVYFIVRDVYFFGVKLWEKKMPDTFYIDGTKIVGGCHYHATANRIINEIYLRPKNHE